MLKYHKSGCQLNLWVCVFYIQGTITKKGLQQVINFLSLCGDIARRLLQSILKPMQNSVSRAGPLGNHVLSYSVTWIEASDK